MSISVSAKGFFPVNPAIAEMQSKEVAKRVAERNVELAAYRANRDHDAWCTENIVRYVSGPLDGQEAGRTESGWTDYRDDFGNESGPQHNTQGYLLYELMGYPFSAGVPVYVHLSKMGPPSAA